MSRSPTPKTARTDADAEAPADTSAPRIWIEVDDLLRHFDGSLTPTGIDRVQLELFRPLVSACPDRVRFLRIGGGRHPVSLLNYREVQRLADGDDYLARHNALPALLPLRKLARYLSRRGRKRLRQLRGAGDLRRFEAAVRPGDVVLCIGGSWSRPGFGASVAELKRRYGVRFAVLFHDLLPVTHPQFVAPRHIPTFTRWLHDMAGLVDLALTPSRSSAAALEQWLAGSGFPVPPIVPVRFGAGYSSAAPNSATPAPRRHVLYVSTIEVRKNHMTLFRVWQRLIAEHGADRVPPLVFAGKCGWEIDELKAALAETAHLDGKIRTVHDLTDAELGELYRNALFTVFPSACEGWGLPVAESLYFGRYCIASDATSIPEVGGPFAGYHDPFDTEAAYRMVERALFEPGFVEAKERAIAAGYAPPRWSDTARAVVEAIDGVRTA